MSGAGRLRKALVPLVLVALAAAGLQTRAPTAAILAQSLQGDVSRPQLRVGIARAGGGYAVATIALETYVARVLAGEAARDSPPAALEALAITVRTFALANRGRHRADGFDLCDQTHCQVLRGARAVTERAATATAGLVLLRGGVPADVSGQDLRVVVGRTLGWQHIMSAAFEVRRVGNRYQFTGHGAGHGVGLCVIGSVGLAAAGKDAADILDRYFPGLEIGSPGSSAAVNTPDAFGTAGARPGARVGPATAAAVPDVLVSLPDAGAG